MAGNIGMMNEAYFLSKAVLLDWVNNFLQLNLEKVEQMATGACYCNLFDALHPKTIPMSKVDFSVKYDYEYSKNWKLLQNAFLKVGIKKMIPVERLTKARYQDNLEFLQWFYKYAHDSYPGDCDNPEYDAISARMRSKGGKDFRNSNQNARLRIGNNNNRRGKENVGIGNARPPSARNHSNNKYNHNNNNNNNNNASSSSLGSMRGRNNHSNSSMRGRNNHNNNASDNLDNYVNNRDMRESMHRELESLREENNKLLLNNQTLKTQFDTLNSDHSELRNVAKDIEKERDFYFNKVLEVETICKQFNDQSLPLLQNIYNILYASDENADAAGNGDASNGDNMKNNVNSNSNNNDNNNNVNNNGNEMNIDNNVEAAQSGQMGQQGEQGQFAQQQDINMNVN